MDARGSKDTNLRIVRLARAIWGQYGAVIMKEWEERTKREKKEEG